jgi:hypothetical protein
MLEKLPEAIGHALENQRAGMAKILFQADAPGATTPLTELSSPAFDLHSEFPQRFTADAEGISPPLRWRSSSRTRTPPHRNPWFMPWSLTSIRAKWGSSKAWKACTADRPRPLRRIWVAIPTS